MPYVEATGAKLYFEESGYGYPIIFIHEFASDIRGWEAQVRYFSRSYRCIAYNARGYPPSDVPEDASLYRWQFAIDDIAAVMRDLKIERAHLVGLSMGGYAALQFGLRYPEKASAIVAASVGSGSHPSQRGAWLRETSVLARVFIDHGMVGMAERMARGPARIQLKYKDRTSWREFVVRLRQHSPQGMSNTMARCQALRPSLHDLRDQLYLTWRFRYCSPWVTRMSAASRPNLMLKSVLPNAGLWSVPILATRSIWKSRRHSMLKSKASWALSSAAAGVTDFREPRLIQAWDCLEAHVETIRASRSIRKQPVPTWFVCTTDDGLELR